MILALSTESFGLAHLVEVAHWWRKERGSSQGFHLDLRDCYGDAFCRLRRIQEAHELLTEASGGAESQGPNVLWQLLLAVSRVGTGTGTKIETHFLCGRASTLVQEVLAQKEAADRRAAFLSLSGVGELIETEHLQ